jgi:hypothetical protein
MKRLKILILATGLLVPAAALADQIVTLKTRGDSTQSYLLLADPGAALKVVAVMFPGGQGQVRLPAELSRLDLNPRGNFLVRTREMFREPELAVAIIDAPSDRQQAGMDDGFRTGREHSDDLAAVVKDLRGRFPQAKVFLVGTSRGTLSAAYVGRALNGAVDGVVLTSTVLFSGRRGMSLSGFDFGAIKAPLLFVHHAQDACRVCPYSAAEYLGRTYPLITVRGGKPAESEECEPLSAHGYYGKEAETVSAIKSWILGQPYPKVVE